MENFEALIKKYWWILAIGGLGVVGVLWFESRSSSGSTQTIVPTSGSTGAGTSPTATDLGTVLGQLMTDVNNNTAAISALGSGSNVGGSAPSAGLGSSETAAQVSAQIASAVGSAVSSSLKNTNQLLAGLAANHGSGVVSQAVPVSTSTAIQVSNPSTAKALVSANAALFNNVDNTAQYTLASALAPVNTIGAAQQDLASGVPLFWKNPQGVLVQDTGNLQTTPGDRTLYTAG